MLTGYLQLKVQKTTIIFNPKANLGRALQIEEKLRSCLPDNSHIEWIQTEHIGHATHIAQSAVESCSDRIIAIGGDGTIHEVINGLMKSRKEKLPILGIVPVGSGNDFAFSLGISTDPSKALDQSLSGEDQPIDIGYLKNSKGEIEYWSNAVGIGFDAIVVIHTRKMQYLKGFTVYFAAVLRTLFFNHNAFHLETVIDNKNFDKNLLMLALCNGQREGGGFYLAPQAEQNDGFLDFVILNYVSKIKLLASLPKFLDGTHTKLAHVDHGQFRSIKINAKQPLIIHTDGEIYAGFDSSIKEMEDSIPKLHTIQMLDLIM